MRTKLSLFIILTLFVSASCVYASDVVKGDVIVVLKNTSGVRIQSAAWGGSSVKSLSAVKSFTRSANVSVKNTFEALSEQSDNIFMVVHSDTKDEKDLLREIKARPDVIAASLNHKFQIKTSDMTPNDPEFYQLWGHEAINSNYAWNFSTGSEDVYAAIIDSGVDYEHEDLKANFSHEYSRNFVKSANGEYDPDAYKDVHDHGSHVAGIIAGVGNNGLGVTGVNWKTKIIALRVFNENGYAEDADVIAAINYVAELLRDNPKLNLASINLSLGGYETYIPEEEYESTPHFLAIKAVSDTNRTVICIAAGNEAFEVGSIAIHEDKDEKINVGMSLYPASLIGIKNMIVVAAANSSLQRSFFSNYGRRYVDIAAPGEYIFSTVRTKASDDIGGGVNPFNRTYYYANISGTSMATPYVAGSAALLKAIYPNADASQIKAALLGGANGDYLRDDNTSMHGLLDLKGAVDFLASSSSENEPPKIESLSAIESIINQTYNMQFYASGSQPLTWSIEGNLPEGLSFDNGRISGTPKNIGTTSLILFAENDYGSDSFVFDINISAGIAPKFQEDEEGEEDELYVNIVHSADINLSQGSWPITYELVDNNMPDDFNFEINNSTGKYKFTPTNAGTYSFTLQAKNYAGSDTKTITLKFLEAQAPEIQEKNLINGVKGIVYGASSPSDIMPIIMGTKKSGDYIKAKGFPLMSWDITGLPEGLKFQAHDNGVSITGTPEEAGSFDLIINAQNDYGSDTKIFTLTVENAAPSFANSTLTINESVGNYVRRAFLSYGTSPMSFDLTGTLPDGLEFFPGDHSVALCGIPTQTGTFNLLLNAHNDYGSTSYDITMNISDQIKIITYTLPEAVKDEAYNFSLRSFNNNQLIYNLSGDFPDGLTLSENGDFTGTPTEAGEFTFSITASSELSKQYNISKMNNFTLIVKAKPEFAASSTLTDGKINTPYMAKLECEGTEPLTWSLTSSDFPAGLSLSSNGYIHGIPLESGDFTFTLTAMNSAGRSSKNFTIKITEDNSKIIEYEDETDPSKTVIIRQGPSREISDLTNGELAGIIDANKMIAAILPEISVNISNRYDFASVDCFANIKISSDIPAGYALEWNAFTRDISGAFVRDVEADSEAIFYDVQGNIIDTVPEDHIVNVSAWLDSGKTYAPVIAASANSKGNPGSSGGGCNAGYFGMIIFLLAALILNRRFLS